MFFFLLSSVIEVESLPKGFILLENSLSEQSGSKFLKTP